MRGMAPPVTASAPDLRAQMEALGRSLGRREAAGSEALAEAWRRAEGLRSVLQDAVDGLHEGLARGGASWLRLEVGPARLDEKHVQAVQIEVGRGRTRLLVTVKSRGEVVLVGPFRTGRTEGPCQKLGWDDEAGLRQALAERLATLAEQALMP